LSVGLEALELVEGAVEGALDAGLVAAEGGEDPGVFLEDVGEAAAWREAGVVLIHVLLIVDVAQAEEGGFEGAGGLEVVEEVVA
jgi:hypothetical protein